MLYNKLKLKTIPEPIFAHVYSCPGYESKFKVMLPSVEIAYVKIGELQVEICGEKFVAKEKSFLVLPHNHKVFISETNKEPHVHYTISAMVDPEIALEDCFSEKLQEKELILPIVICEGENTYICEKLLYDAINEYHKAEEIGKLKSGILVAELLCELSKMAMKSSEKRKSSRAEILDLRIKKYIEKNIHMKILLSDIAEALGKNANYLNQVFSGINHMSIISYINLEKMKKAATLMVDKGLSVKETAKEVGIKDLSYFSKLFKQKMGMTISEYKSNSAEYTFSLIDNKKNK